MWLRKASPVLYHGTGADFTEFDTERGELGTHFGTPEQVEDVLDQGGNFEINYLDPEQRDRHFRELQHLRVYPANVELKNPLRLRDVGRFSADAVAPQLADLGIISLEDMDAILALSPNDQNQVLQSAIMNAGYDGIVYLNRREGIGKRDDYGKDSGWDGTSEWELEATDEQFRKSYPQAGDSYIVFDQKQIQSPWSP